jgi:beta-lactamase regulating signal transducer with metallopeptidase domain
MIIRAEGPPPRRPYSLGVVGSVVIHALLVAAVLYVASRVAPRQPVEPAYSSGRSSSRHASALARGGSAGGDPTGTLGTMGAPPPASEPSESWPVEQAKRLELRLGIAHAIDHLWQSTLFAVAAGLLTLAFRRNRARVRFALWFAASVKFLVPFSVIVWLGSLIASSAFAVLGPFTPFGASGSFARLPLIGGIGQSIATTATTALWPSTITISEVTSAWLSLALVGVWTSGFFAIVAARVRLSRRLWNVVLTARRVVLIDVRVPKRLQVGLADGLLEPGVIGWVRPVLLLPADIEDHLTRPEIEAIVAHELCHVRRFDNMTAAIHMLVEAIFWFHPLVWWLGSRMIDERERACDEHVLRTVGTPGPYAHGILNVCKRYAQSPLASVSGVGSANVRQRIEAILANRIGEATGVWQKMLLSALMLCVVIVPMAAGALQAQPDTTSRPDAAGATTAYALVVAHADRLGPGLTRVPVSAEAGGADSVDARLGTISVDGITSSRLAALLARVLDHPVDDRTGLKGQFNVRLTWDSHAGTVSLQTAMQQQLGLQLVPSARISGGSSPTSR